jgi:pimeloyl-ACP methyl ester carboxylesterase
MKILPRLARHLGAALIGLAALQAHATIDVQDRTVNAAGLQLHTLQAGSGPETPVVLLHGYAETSHMWLPLIPRLADRRVVLAPDLPGAGTSSIPAMGFDKKTLAQDIHAMVQAMGYRKVKLVGHDIGLMVAYAYAAQYPDEVESITLMDAFLPGVGDWQKVWLLRDLWHFHFYGDTPLKLVRGRERIYFEHFWNDFAADPKRSLPEADRQFYARTYGQPGRMAAGFAKTPLPMPMLVLAGERASGAFLIEQAKLVATNVNGVTVKGSGHWLMEEAPDATMTELVRFINNTPA